MSSDEQRVPTADGKAKVLAAIDRSRQVTRLAPVLRLIGLSPTRYHERASQKAKGCDLADPPTYARTSPGSLTSQEVRDMRDLAPSYEFRHMPVFGSFGSICLKVMLEDVQTHRPNLQKRPRRQSPQHLDTQTPMNLFRLHPLVARWLRAETTSLDADETPDWDVWLLRRMSHGHIIDVGGVLVDQAVLRQRFDCVSNRCAPGTKRGSYRSCCADAFVALSRAEDRRLASQRGLLPWTQGRELRLARCQGQHFYRAEGELGLARPGGRCVFSKLDPHGRIRCHLFAYAKQASVDRGELQPVSCRLFPLIVVDRGHGRVLLTVVANHTRRLVSAYPVKRYPCLSDRSLPPLFTSMRRDLDWLFGPGFANALAQASKR